MGHTQIDPEALKRVNDQLERDWRDNLREEMGFWEIVTLAVLLLLAVAVMMYPALTTMGVMR